MIVTHRLFWFLEPNNNADAPSIESKRSGDVKLIQQERMLTNDNVTHKPIVELNGRGTKCKIRYTKRFLDALLKEKEAALKQTTNVKPVVTVQGELKGNHINLDNLTTIDHIFINHLKRY